MDRAKQLAMILQAIDDAEQDFAELRAGHKERMETLRGELNRARRDVLSGQLTLITPEPAVGE